MPLPWKKAKGSRISQLVASHLNSPQRGGSLVVETGFPTSLVDLFVKNRERLKRSTKKRRSETVDPSNPQPSVSPQRFKNSLDQSLFPESRNRPPTSCFIESPTGNEFAVKGVVSFGAAVAETAGDVAADTKGIFLAVLKIFVVVLLTLGMKRLTVGITLSAFLLFFFEYLGKYQCISAHLCPNALKLVIQRVFCFLGINQTDSNSNPERGLEDSSRLIDRNIITTSAEEIHIIEPPNSNFTSLVHEVQSVEEKFNTVSCNMELAYEELDPMNGVVNKEGDCVCHDSGLEIRKSRRARIKSKVSKLVPKKLRYSRRKSPDPKGEACSEGGEDKVNQSQELEDAEPYECDDELSSFSNEKDDRQEIDAGAVCSFRKSSQEGMDLAVLREEEVEGREGHSRCLVLCLIVLLGLVGGRILALVLILLWCLMLRSSETLRRSIKIPAFWYFLDICS